jgi:hypothetical protein
MILDKPQINNQNSTLGHEQVPLRTRAYFMMKEGSIISAKEKLDKAICVLEEATADILAQ